MDTPPTRHSGVVEIGGAGTASTEFAATVLSASADTVLAISPAGRILFVSSTKPILVGMLPQEWHGRSIEDLLHPDDVAPFRALLETPLESIDGPRRYVIRVRVLGASGDWVLIEARGFTRIVYESIVAFVVSFRDAAGLLGLSEARLLADRTLVDATPDSATIDHRHMTAAEILPAVLRSCATAKHLCIVSLRMTNFDAVSRESGRAAAEQVVVQTARAILPTLRPSDLVVRVLDRRLVVACPNLEASVVVKFAKRLRRVCDEVELANGATIIPSIGFALSSGGDDLHHVLEYALDANQLDSDCCI